MIDKLRPSDLNCNVFSIDDYDYQDMTIQELLCTFFTKINECVDVSNESLNYLEWLKGQGLRAETIKVLNEWFTNGKLGELIKKEVLGDFEKRISANADKISTNETRIEELDHDTKANVSNIEQNKKDIATNEQHIQKNLDSINEHNTRIQKAETRLTGLKEEMINLLYPVGSIIQLSNETNPNTIYTGTSWVKIEGRFLVGKSIESEFNQLGKVGGEKAVTLTLGQLPVFRPSGSFLTQNTDSKFASLSGGSNYGWGAVGEIGGGGSHNNLPPYKVVAIWERTA